MGKRNSQEKAILNYLLENGSITSMESFNMLGVTRLAAYIHNLRNDGYKITTEMCSGRNRFGNAVSFAKYILEND